MEAPVYNPAASFEQPTSLRQALSTRTSSIGELKQDPEALAILRKMLPTMAAADSGPVAILIEAMSIRSAVSIGGLKPDDVAKIEAEFIKLNAARGITP